MQAAPAAGMKEEVSSPRADRATGDVTAAPEPTAPAVRPRPRRLFWRHQWGEYITAGIVAFYLVSIIIAPLFFPPDSLDFGEKGISGRIDFEAERQKVNMTGWWYALYWEGDLNHHQKASRSYFLNGNEMPQDSRDLGIYAGIIFALVYASRRMYRIKGWGLLLGLVPIGLDGGTQLFTSFVTINPMRVFTGFVCGLTVGFALAAVFFDTMAPQWMQDEHSRKAKLETPAPGARPGNPVLRVRLYLLRLGSPVEKGDREFFWLTFISTLVVIGHILLFEFAGVRLYRQGW